MKRGLFQQVFRANFVATRKCPRGFFLRCWRPLNGSPQPFCFTSWCQLSASFSSYQFTGLYGFSISLVVEFFWSFGSSSHSIFLSCFCKRSFQTILNPKTNFSKGWLEITVERTGRLFPVLRSLLVLSPIDLLTGLSTHNGLVQIDGGFKP